MMLAEDLAEDMKSQVVVGHCRDVDMERVGVVTSAGHCSGGRSGGLSRLCRAVLG